MMHDDDMITPLRSLPPLRCLQNVHHTCLHCYQSPFITHDLETLVNILISSFKLHDRKWGWSILMLEFWFMDEEQHWTFTNQGLIRWIQNKKDKFWQKIHFESIHPAKQRQKHRGTTHLDTLVILCPWSCHTMAICVEGKWWKERHKEDISLLWIIHPHSYPLSIFTIQGIQHVHHHPVFYTMLPVDLPSGFKSWCNLICPWNLLILLILLNHSQVVFPRQVIHIYL